MRRNVIMTKVDIDNVFWQTVIKKWSNRKEERTDRPTIKPVDLSDEDENLQGTDVDDILSDLDDLDDLFD